ncbi:hypothetical protein BESB_017470 [Besnoitia besnoiti]|uniref:Uncharacterized protein n=1 Tax=Besnoitia besnoiti TaxID=94643 RepID=A0A2A9M3B4_BESBE|nr:hypothetical protein BESB_017470 [Besnoitia besnoiti]PFH32429.1 hypothetical protein BESB_017470 [Besnoitia besnoiti]
MRAPTTEQINSLTWVFQVDRVKNLPKEVPTRIEISGAQLLDAICSEKLLVRVVDASPELKEKPAIGVLTLGLTSLIHDATALEGDFEFTLESEYLSLMNSASDPEEKCSIEFVLRSSAPLGFPEDAGDWNIFSVKVDEVARLPPSLAAYGVTAAQDADSHPFTYSVHILGCKIGGGRLVLPPAGEEKKAGDKSLAQVKSKGAAEKLASTKSEKSEKAARREGGEAAPASSASSLAASSKGEFESDISHSRVFEEEDLPQRVDLDSDAQAPHVTWSAQREARFYRGRQFLSQLLCTVDSAAGLWAFVTLRPKRELDEKATKGGAKHAKAPPPKGKAATKVDSQALVEVCRRYTGRARIPLEDLRRAGACEVSGTFELESVQLAPANGEETLLSPAAILEGGDRAKKTETGSSLASSVDTPRDTFEENKTTLKIKIQLKFPLQPLEPRDLLPLAPSPDLSAKTAEGTSSSRVCCSASPQETRRERNEFARRGNGGGSWGGGPMPSQGSQLPWETFLSKRSLGEFKACVEKGIQWIAHEMSRNLPEDRQRLLARTLANEAEAVESERTQARSEKGRSETTLRPGEAGGTSSGTRGNSRQAAEGDRDPDPKELSSAFVQLLKANGCYDELFANIQRVVILVIRDRVRRDIGLAAAATAATRGYAARTLTEDMLQQKLDKFLSETFAFLVGTMQNIVNETSSHSQSLRQLAELYPPNSPLLSHVGAEGAEQAFARLAFEAEVTGDLARAIALHRRQLSPAERLEKPHGAAAASLWFALARLLLRCSESHVEEAEEVLWESIKAQGGTDKASSDTLLMLGCCRLHRGRYREAETAFSYSVKRCGGATRDTEFDPFPFSDERSHLCSSPFSSPAFALTVPPLRRQEERAQAAADGRGLSQGAATKREEEQRSEQRTRPPSFCVSDAKEEGRAPPPKILPLFCLSVCHYLAGNRAKFMKFLALTLKPAAIVEAERDLNEAECRQVAAGLRNLEEEKKTSEKAGSGAEDKLTVQNHANTKMWMEGLFDELEQMLPVFAKDTFYSPATVDYPTLSFLLMLLNFGLPTLCLSFVDRGDEFVHSQTAKSGLFTFIKAKALFLKKDFVGAARALRRLLGAEPRHRQALSLLAESYYRLRLVQVATHAFQQSIDFLEEPQDCVIYLRLGELMLMRKDYEQARAFYQKSLHYSTTSGGWLGVAVSLYRLGDLSAAVEAAITSNSQDRDRGETWGYLALCFLSLERSEEADMCTRFMIKKGLQRPQQQGGLAALGGAVTERKHSRIDPDNLFDDKTEITSIEWGGGLLVEVAHAYVGTRGPCGAETAETLARMVLEEEPGSPAARKVLAQALACQEHYEAALVELLTVMRCVVEEFKETWRRGLQRLHDLFYDAEDGVPEGARHSRGEQNFADEKHAAQLKLTEAFEQCQNLSLFCSRATAREASQIHRTLTEELSQLTLSSLAPGALSERELDSDL